MRPGHPPPTVLTVGQPRSSKSIVQSTKCTTIPETNNLPILEETLKFQVQWIEVG